MKEIQDKKVDVGHSYVTRSGKLVPSKLSKFAEYSDWWLILGMFAALMLLGAILHH